MTQPTRAQIEAELERRRTPPSGLTKNDIISELERRRAGQAAQQQQAAQNVPGVSAPAPAPTAPRSSGDRAQDLLTEGMAGLSRPVMWVTDLFLPGTPMTDTVGRKGDYAGEGMATDIAAMSGELASAAVPIGAASRWVGKGIHKAISRIPESVRGRFMNTLFKKLGQVRGAANTGAVAEDVAFGVGGGVGGGLAGQAAVEMFGEEARETGAAIGEVVSVLPMAALQNGFKAWHNAAESLLSDALNNKELSIDAVRGARKVHYDMMEAAGIKANGPSTSQFQNTLEKWVMDTDVDLDRAGTPVAGIVRTMKKASEEGRLSYAFLDKQISRLNDLAATGETGSFYAKELSSLTDDFLSNMEITEEAIEALGGKTYQEVRRVAKSLYQREQTYNAVSDIWQKAAVQSESGPRSKNFVEVLDAGLRDAASSDSGQFRYLTGGQRQQIMDIAKDGELGSKIRKLSALGINSNDFIKTIMVSGTVGMVAGGMTGSAAVAGGVFLSMAAVAKATTARANALYRANANLGRQMLLTDGDPRKIARAYLANTPRAMRNEKDLAIMLRQNTADLSQYSGESFVRQSNLMQGAFYLATQLDRLEQEEQMDDVPAVPPSMQAPASGQ